MTLSALVHFLKEKFDLTEDQAAEIEVKENIRRGVEFRGTNLWVLIFATFVASLGLNVNSTAVIIGAMLISPLMGPIMGIGMSVGINDFELMKRSLRNFGFMVLVAILTSTCYFMLSPLSQAQSELLARTTPTTYDVFIAFFGGLAGIVAQSRKDRTSTVIPGVAIATALMPPLCTAGYGLATLQFNYFIGAFYLFFINTVFIAIATYIVVRFLKYSRKEFLDPRREKKVRRYIFIVVIATLIPSVVLGYRIVQRTIFETNADRYVATAMHFPKAQVVDYTRGLRADGSAFIEVVLLGEAVTEDVIESVRLQMANYKLSETELIVHQSGTGDGKVDYSTLQTGYRELITEKNRRIAELQSQITQGSDASFASQDIAREIASLSPEVRDASVARTVMYAPTGASVDTVVVCLLQLKENQILGLKERDRLTQWLKQRTKIHAIKLYTE